MPHDVYETPLNTRYASAEMSGIWSAQTKHSTWRRLWVALAEAEAELGLDISPQQLDEMRAHIDDIDFDVAARYEKEFRHDVMAHVHTYGDKCPSAKGVIHLGATSCYVTDNSELIQIREGLKLVQRRLVQVIDALGRFASTHRDLPCL
ncbi:MAG: adenylosuccinate lyase, partial [Planctomycetaceae bacterium]|nr:adenylosuccinate lyase [Planctomycetaceae bacterium]